MSTKSDKWYIHAVLYVIIIILAYLLIKVAIIDPTEKVEKEKYYTNESRLRMKNLREAQILYQKKHDKFSDNLDSLIHFIKNDSFALAMRDSVIVDTLADTLRTRYMDPFLKLVSGPFYADSLFKTPKSGMRYIVKVDTNVVVDSVVNSKGRLIRVDSNITIGELYLIEDPDGYGKIGDVTSQALKNTADWE